MWDLGYFGFSRQEVLFLTCVQSTNSEFVAFSILGKQIRRPGERASQGYLSESVRKTKVRGWRGAGRDFTEVGL